MRGRFIGMAAVVALSWPITTYYEGLSLKAHLDPVGIPTICHGETEGVKMGQVRTPEDCHAMLDIKLAYIAMRIDQMVDKPMPVETHAAMTSFTYNVGLGAFRKSTIYRKLNAGDIEGACNQLPRWTYAGGKKFNGLVKRREAERELCLRGV